MRAWQVIILLLLAAAIFGPAGYFLYQINYAPVVRQKAYQAEEARRASLPPPPDPQLPALKAAETLKNSGKFLDAKLALEKILKDHPKSAVIGDVKRLLGQMNAALFLSNMPSPDKQEYVVQSGDTLTRVQSKTKVPMDLLVRVNNLKSTRLNIGQKLYYTTAEFGIIVYPAHNVMELTSGGKFFKQYSYEPVNLPKPNPKGAATKVNDIANWWEGERVTFDSPNYAQSNRRISFGDRTSIFAPAPQGWDLPDPSEGYKMAPHDIAEIQALIKKGSPVTIAPPQQSP